MLKIIAQIAVPHTPGNFLLGGPDYPCTYFYPYQNHVVTPRKNPRGMRHGIAKLIAKIYNVEMQNIIAHTRSRLSPFLGGEAAVMPSELNISQGNAMPVQYLSRFARKIPVQNYQKIEKFVPISWL